jgi:hypothetical protein
MGLELLEYRYDEPLFLYREADNDLYENGTLNAAMPCWTENKKPSTVGKKTADGEYQHIYDPLIKSLNGVEISPTKIYLVDPNTSTTAKLYCMAKIDFGETAGFRLTELVYPGSLVGNVGESLTSILDKIKNMLGEFEYFYDLDGNFIF